MPEQSERKDAMISDEQIAARAYQKWKERGCPLGDGRRDWYDAVAEMDPERDRREYEAAIALYD